MKNFNRPKKPRVFTKKSYYTALAVCTLMLGAACFGSYKQTEKKIGEELSSVVENQKAPVVTGKSEEKKTVDVAGVKPGVKKETRAPEQTKPAVTVKEEVHSEPRIEESPARKYSIPVNGQIIQEFSGDELIKNQTTGAWQTHYGMDIAANPGDEVRAMYEGTVTDVLEDPLWGVTVVIDHGEGISARYCGLNKGLNVTKDDKVSSQDVIGAVGDTMDIESSMEPHLHFEVLKNGKYINPLDFINGRE